MPSVSFTAVDRMSLRWYQSTYHPLTGGKSGTIVVVVMLIEEQPEVDAKSIVAAAANILEPEINGIALHSL